MFVELLQVDVFLVKSECFFDALLLLDSVEKIEVGS